jgi:hypothetical protein
MCRHPIFIGRSRFSISWYLFSPCLACQQVNGELYKIYRMQRIYYALFPLEFETFLSLTRRKTRLHIKRPSIHLARPFFIAVTNCTLDCRLKKLARFESIGTCGSVRVVPFVHPANACSVNNSNL